MSQDAFDESQFEKLMDDLERIRTASNVHTINKARGYLRSFYKGAWFLQNDDERAQLLQRHIKRCREAVATKNVERLRISMIRWF